MEGGNIMAGTDLAPIWIAGASALVSAVVVLGITKLDRFTVWARRKRQEELDSRLLEKIDAKLDARHDLLTSLSTRVDDTRRALELHTSQEADLVTKVVEDALKPVLGRLDAIDQRLDAAKL